MPLTQQLRRFLKAPEPVLVVTTIVWGPTYLIMKRGLLLAGPMFLVGSRFAAAALVLFLVAGGSLGRPTYAEIRAGLLIGTSMMMSYAFLALGLLSIASSEAAILSALYVPMVPLLQWLLLRRPPKLLAWLGTLLALTGLVLVAGPDKTSFGFGMGELWMILCALATAGEVILISAFSRSGNTRQITMIQLAAAALLSLAAMSVTGEALPSFSWWLAAISIGLGITSAGVQLAMNWAQRTVSPTRATLIYTAEPIWAAVVGRLAGEMLPVSTVAGAAFILGGILVGELRIKAPREAKP